MLCCVRERRGGRGEGGGDGEGEGVGDRGMGREIERVYITCTYMF